MRAYRLFLLLLLTACADDEAPARGGLTLQEALGGEADTAFLRADEPRRFHFPADHGLHPGYRNEWWYLTGNLLTGDDRRFGYQLTFFTMALPEQDGAAAGSAWHSERLWMAHLALTDMAAGEHYAFERFSRENPGLAGAVDRLFGVWLQDWQLTGGLGDNVFPWRVDAGNDTIGLSLVLDTAKPPVLQGEGGLSRKSATPGNASYYYSLTRMPTRGTIRVGNATFSVDGLSWLDREWSTSALDDDQTGWDWFSLQFDDGRELMYYQLRDVDGQVHPYSAGNLTTIDAEQVRLTPDDVMLTSLRTWTSPTGTTYDTAWRLAYAGQRWRVEAVLEDQWNDLSLPYWEGAVDVMDEESGARVGHGYLEMVR